MSSVASTRVRLFHDGALQVVVDDDLLDLVEPWLPTPPLTGEPRSEPLARITVGRTTPNRPDALVGRTIVAGNIDVHVDASRGWAILDGEAIGCSGFVDLDTLDATLAVEHRTSAALESMQMMLTVTAALLMQRLGRAMMHSA